MIFCLLPALSCVHELPIEILGSDLQSPPSNVSSSALGGDQHLGRNFCSDNQESGSL